MNNETTIKTINKRIVYTSQGVILLDRTSSPRIVVEGASRITLAVLFQSLRIHAVQIRLARRSRTTSN